MSILTTLRALVTAGKGIVVGMPDANAMSNPIDLFKSWFLAAQRSGIFMPEALSLSTSTADGRPSSRMVLLKSVDERGFVFFTNYESRKANDMEANPHVALLFHWPVLERQVRVEGTVERVGAEESDAYFRSRPKGSRLGAWASRQSRPLADRKTLEDAVNEITRKFEGQEIPRPEHWGGYLVRPHTIEFWQGRPFRLHDRIVFRATNAAEPGQRTWSTVRLYP